MHDDAPKSTAAGEAVSTWLTHIRALAEGIGPRGSATEGERKGADYCEAIFKKLGYRPVRETFPSSGSVFKPHLAAAFLMLIANILYPLAGRATAWLAAGLSILVVGSEILELSLLGNPLRWILPKKPSQNVFALVEPSGARERDIVLVGHVDTQRTPVIFSSPGWLSAYKIMSTLAFAAFIAQAALHLYGALARAAWVFPASLAAVPFVLLLLALTIHAECTPFTPGANDNASAAGLVLAAAEELKRAPLARTRVWLVCTGSEEALHEGARHFFRTHRHELVKPCTINLEMLGCAGPAWLVREGIVTPLRPSPALLSLAETIARDNPHLGAYPARLEGGVTEASDSINLGVPAITLMGMDRQNHAPYWHRMEDTADRMEPEVMGRAYMFTREMLHAIDRGD